MKRLLVWIICWLNNVILTLQYPPPTYRRLHSAPTPTTNSCDSNKAALVEHFFTVIFSEFRNPTPVCVCVQMCVNQATYCYPNGCLRKSDENQNPGQETPEDRPMLTAENRNPMFLVDNAGNQVAKVGNEGFADSIQPTTSDPYLGNNMQLYTFDSYKPVYKYRKLPTVHMQYNLREQIKNTKSNAYSDITSSGRWPLNKMKQVTIGKSYQPDMTIDRSSRRSKYFRHVPSLVPRFSKRDLKLSENQPDNYSIDVTETNYAPEKFSLEKLINDLIESSIDSPENSNKRANVTEASKISNIVQTNLITSTDKIIPLSTTTSDTSSDIIYETTTVIVPKDTNDLIDNKTLDYDDDLPQIQTEIFKNIYNDDSIESLSKRIDKLNNTSYEILNMNSNHVPIKEDSRSTEVNKMALSYNCTNGTEVKAIKDGNTSKNSTSLVNN